MSVSTYLNIDRAVLENIDIDMEILENIDIDKISNQLEFGISNRARFGGGGAGLLILAMSRFWTAPCWDKVQKIMRNPERS